MVFIMSVTQGEEITSVTVVGQPSIGSRLGPGLCSGSQSVSLALLLYQSAHMLVGVISCPKRRAERVCTEGLSQELQHLSSALMELSRSTEAQTRQSDEQMMPVLPYIKELSEKICMACCPINVLTVLILHNIKEPPDPHQDSNIP